MVLEPMLYSSEYRALCIHFGICQNAISSLGMNPSAGSSLCFSVEVTRRSRAGGHWHLGVFQGCTVRGSPASLRQPLPSDLVQKSSLQMKRLCCFARLESQCMCDPSHLQMWRIHQWQWWWRDGFLVNRPGRTCFN